MFNRKKEKVSNRTWSGWQRKEGEGPARSERRDPE